MKRSILNSRFVVRAGIVPNPARVACVLVPCALGLASSVALAQAPAPAPVAPAQPAPPPPPLAPAPPVVAPPPAPPPPVISPASAPTPAEVPDLPPGYSTQPPLPTVAPEPAPAAAAKPTPEITAAPGKGLTIKVGDAFSFNLRSRFQLRYQLDIPPEGEAQQLVNIGTARLWFSGNVFNPQLTYMLQLAVAGRDYRDGAISPIFDAYIDYKPVRDFNIRAGQFFVPFDRLRTVREFALQMADRPVPIGELTLDRDVGVVFYSEKFLGSPLAYRLGVFNGGGTNLTTGKDPGALLLGRLELRPLGPIDDDSEGDLERRHVPGLAIGAGIARNFSTNRQRSTTGTTYTGGDTDYLHIAADAVFKWYGFAAQLEYLYKNASEDVLVSFDEDGGQINEWTRSGSGFIAQASYTFDPPFEIVGRFSKLHAFDGTDPRLVDTDEYGVGFNYYINGHQFKIQTDWIAKIPSDGNFSDDAVQVAHVQLDATF